MRQPAILYGGFLYCKYILTINRIENNQYTTESEMTVKREKLTVDVYYASETAEGKNVLAKITVVTYK